MRDIIASDFPTMPHVFVILIVFYIEPFPMKLFEGFLNLKKIK